MRLKSYEQAVQVANAAGMDAANKRMRKAGRKVWTEADYAHAVAVSQKFLTDLGYDIYGWMAMAGVPRNEPEAPPTPKGKRKSRPKSSRRSGHAPVQLSFSFA